MYFRFSKSALHIFCLCTEAGLYLIRRYLATLVEDKLAELQAENENVLAQHLSAVEARGTLEAQNIIPTYW